MTSLPPVELRMPRRSEHEEMLDGKLYRSGDPELNALLERSADLCNKFNALPRGATAERNAILDELLPGHGEHLDVMGPVFFDYGCHTTIGERVFMNFNFTCLDCVPVTIGDDVIIGAGSVVTRDIPAGVFAAGNPCRVIRPFCEEDKEKYPIYQGE